MPTARLSALDLSSITIPHHFRCPISLELMRDPVTVSTGQTYDRASIESWVATGHTTCPVTRAPLVDHTLIPNHTLRRLIQHWCVAHKSQGVERIPTPKQPADPSQIHSLLLSAASKNASSSSRLAAIRRLLTLAKDSEHNRSLIAPVSVVIDVAFENLNPVDFEDDFESVSIEAMSLLAMLPLSEADSMAVTTRPARLTVLGEILGSNLSLEARIAAAGVVEAVAAAARSSETRVVIGRTDGVIGGLVNLSEHSRGVRVGIRGLFSLCLAKENRSAVVAAGAAAAVVKRIKDLGGGDAERALAMVELLCRTESGREAVVEGWGGGEAAVKALVRAMAGKASDRAAEHAVGALVAVVGGAGAEEELQRVVVAAGVVPQLLVMVQGGYSERAKRKAQIMLKLLRSAWPRYGNFANSDDFMQAY